MKKILITSIITAIVLLSLASALVSQTNLIKSGILNKDGSITISNDLTDVNVLGFVCTSDQCATYNSTPIFNMSSGPQSQIDLTFPSNLTSNYGYGLYFFKEGYIPLEVLSTYRGSGSAPTATRTLTQAIECTAPISDFNIKLTNSTLEISSYVSSPLMNAGPLIAIPQELADHYKSSVNITTTIIGPMNYTNTELLTLPFTTTSLVYSTVDLIAGHYDLTLSSLPSDMKCLSTNPSVVQTSFVIHSNDTNVTDLTPPNQITDLIASNITNNSITWSWSNPTDLDFLNNIIYINGDNVLNSSANSYTALELLPNTNNTISILTQDISGNINTLPVSSTVSTLNGTDSVNNNTDLVPPTLTVHSPQQIKYTTNQIIVNFTATDNIDNSSSLNLFYNNGTANRTSNLQVLNLADGSYTFVFYAIDSSGNTASQSVTFSVDTNVNNNNNNGGSGGNGGSSSGTSRRIISYDSQENVTRPTAAQIEEQNPIALVPQKSNALNISALMIILSGLVFLLLIIILILLALPKKASKPAQISK
jgi:hypothetical protein